MTPMSPQETRTPAVLWADVLLVIFLIAFDVIARILPHAPGLWPVAATALFAGRVLRVRALALVVPIAALLLSDAVLGFDDWRIASVVYVSLLLPAFAGIVSRRWRGAAAIVATMLACSLIFFVTTNFAVWAFSDIYTHDMQGLVTCYIAGLPFLEKTAVGDLFWTAVLFGGAWLVQHAPVLSRRPL